MDNNYININPLLLTCIAIFTWSQSSFAGVVDFDREFKNGTNFIIETTAAPKGADESISSPNLTNGEIQSSNSVLLVDTITFIVNTTNTSCQGTADGSATISQIRGGQPPYTIEWSNGASGSAAMNLTDGNYQVQVSSNDGSIGYRQFNIGSESENRFCELGFYTGFTPNGDNINDLFIIDNVGLYPTNTLTIYNRYGDQVKSIINYNNTSRVWDGKNTKGNMVPSGTYFYIFEVNGEFRKGWVELTKFI
tara:strand:+ start:946 stop:1695 length:750 start_codon:yes stop_codon:yes gene_type:complete